MILQFIILIFFYSNAQQYQDSIDIVGDNKFAFTQKINNLADTTTSLLYNKKMQASLKKRDTMAIFDMYCFGKDVGERNPKIGLITADSILNIANEINDIRGLISAYNLKGIMFTITDDYNKALDNFNKSLDVANSNLNNSYKRFIDKHAITYYYIGNLYSKRGEYQVALTQYKKALTIINKLTTRDYEIADSLINNLWGRYHYTTYENDKLEIQYALAYTYSILNNIELSNNYLDSCLVAEVKYIDYNILAKVEYLKASNLFKLSNIPESRIHLLKAIKISNYMKNYEYIIKSNILFYRLDANPKYLFDALNNSKLIESVKDESLLYLYISEYYNSVGDYKKSLEYLNEHLILFKKINSEESERKFGKLESDLEYKLKLKTLEQANQLAESEQEIASQRIIILFSTLILGVIVLLVIGRLYLQKRKYISIIENKQSELEFLNKQLKELNLSKIKLFGIISHDLKSPIKEFEIGTKNLLNATSNSSLSTESKSNLEYLNKLSTDISKLLLSLLDWSRSQIENTSNSIDKYCNIKEILEDILNLYDYDIKRKGLILDSTIEITDLNYDENDIKIILRNILQNAIKFSIIDGIISIKNYIEDEYLIITVENQGSPISKNNLNKVENLELPDVKNGVVYEAGTGLGLLKVNEILNSLGGNLILENTDSGVKVYIYLKYT